MAATATTSTEKGRRIVGAERQTLAKDLVKRYQGGESIRSLAASTGRSYGFVHRVLTESGVQLRQRGGVCWSHPAYANKHVFARNDEELVCASLAK